MPAAFRCTRNALTQILLCRDLEDPTTLDIVRAQLPERVRAVYTDPPWNIGISSMFRTRVGLEPCTSYPRLMDAWAAVVGECQSRGATDVIVDHSMDDTQRRTCIDAINRCPRWTLPHVEQWVVQYGSPPRKNMLLHYGKSRLGVDLTGMSSESLLKKAFAGLNLSPGDWIVDPCMGKGMTSRISHGFNCNVLGTELSLDRLKLAVSWLQKKGYTVEEFST